MADRGPRSSAFGAARVRAARRKVLSLLGVMVCVALAAGLVVGSGSNHGPADSEAASARVVSPPAGLTPHQLAGQRIVVGFNGASIPAPVRRGIRAGHVGAVILFADNIPSRSSVRKLTRQLQRIPRPDGLRRFPLPIMTDQEGGLVKRLSGAPNVSAAVMGQRGARFSRDQGRLTARNLRNAGVNIDLAPVVDVARPGGNISNDGRGFGRTAKQVQRTAIPFAKGLQANGVAATAKHFPSLGSVRLNTDDAVQKVNLSKKTIRRVDQAPYRTFIKAGGDLVMVGTAIYPAFSRRPAAFEKKIVTGELRDRLGFEGVTITDALETVAARDFGGAAKVAVTGARAGMDLLLYTDYEEAAKGRKALAKRIRSGSLPRAEFRESVGRILALRSKFAD